MTISTVAAMTGLVVFPLAMIYAGLMDVVTLKIKNVVVLFIGGAWLLLAPLAGFSLHELGASLLVAALVFVLTFTFFQLGWIGGGDAKLAAVTALWFQPHEALTYFVFTAGIGGVLTLLILQLRTAVLPLGLYRIPWIAQLQEPKAGVPYGAAMAPAALLVFPDTAWVLHAAF